MKKLIYVAGPLSADTARCNAEAQWFNVSKAMRMGKIIHDLGGVPLIPHLSWFWATFESPMLGYEDWMEIDFVMLSNCDALYRMPGDSSGGDREVEFAKENGIPVFMGEDVDDRLRFARWLEAMNEEV